MKLVGSANPLNILKPIFSLDQFHFLLYKLLELFLLLSLELALFFIVSLSEDVIDIVLLIFTHRFSHPYLVLLSLYILLFLLLQSYLLFLMQNCLSLVSLRTHFQNLILFSLFYISRILEDLQHLLSFVLGLLLSSGVIHRLFLLELPSYILCMSLSLLKKRPLLCDFSFGLLFGLLNLFFFK